MGFLKNIIGYDRFIAHAHAPFKKDSRDAGFDLSVIQGYNARKGDFIKLQTGIAVEIPKNHVGIVVPRSSTFEKYRFIIPNSPGIIDETYRGELLVAAFFLEDSFIPIEARVAQLLILPLLPEVKFVKMALSDTIRGSGGFGSTGV